jgi:hypothetical protein
VTRYRGTGDTEKKVEGLYLVTKGNGKNYFLSEDPQVVRGVTT